MAFGAAAYAVGTPVRISASGVVAGGAAMARTYAGGGVSQAEQTAGIMMRYEKLLLERKSDLCLVVGDVTSTMACAIAAPAASVASVRP